jgi:RING finger family protein
VLELEVKVRQSAAERCPYCLEGGEIEDARVVCEGCGTTHHQACLAELGGCTVMGCSSLRARPEGGVEEIRERVRARMNRFAARHLSSPDRSAYERMARHWTCSACRQAFAVSDCPSCGAELLRRCTIYGRHCTSCERRFFNGEIVGLENEDREAGARIRSALLRLSIGLIALVVLVFASMVIFAS